MTGMESGIQKGSGKEAGDRHFKGFWREKFWSEPERPTWFPARMNLALPSMGACGNRLAGFRGITGWNAKAALCVRLC